MRLDTWGIARKGPSFTLLHASALFCDWGSTGVSSTVLMYVPQCCFEFIRSRTVSVYFEKRTSNCYEVNSNQHLLNSISGDSFVRRHQYTKHRQMHSNPMACAVEKTITRWKVTTDLSTSSPGSLNVALHLSAWTGRRMVGADVFDGFRIGFMSAKRSCLGEMLQWEGNHANATYCTSFLFHLSNCHTCC